MTIPADVEIRQSLTFAGEEFQLVPRNPNHIAGYLNGKLYGRLEIVEKVVGSTKIISAQIVEMAMRDVKGELIDKVTSAPRK